MLLFLCLGIMDATAQQEVRGVVVSPSTFVDSGGRFAERFCWTIVNKNSFSVYIDIEIIGSEEGVVYRESLVLDSEQKYELKPSYKSKWAYLYSGELKIRENTYTLTYKAYKLE